MPDSGRCGTSVIEPLVQIGGGRPAAAKRRRLPEWARKSKTHFESLNHLKRGLRELKLHTVCEEARCPNIHECFHRGAATFMILGELCTRGCGFCSVQKLNPRKHDVRLDPDEPANVARMAREMKLRYVVITSVNRDDLDDGGSHHFAETVREVRRAAAGGAHRSADAGFLRRFGCGGSRARRRPARLQSQYGNRAAPLRARAAAGAVSASRSTCSPSLAATLRAS